MFLDGGDMPKDRCMQCWQYRDRVPTTVVCIKCLREMPVLHKRVYKRLCSEGLMSQSSYLQSLFMPQILSEELPNGWEEIDHAA